MRQLLRDLRFGLHRWSRRHYMDMINQSGLYPGYHCGQYRLVYDRDRAQVVCEVCSKDVMPEHGPTSPMSRKMWERWATEQ